MAKHPRHLTTVLLRHPLFRGGLQLSRVPKYLRFTCSGIASCSRNWDALDQLDDEPREGEQILVGILAARSSMHLDRVVKGRRVGEWLATAEYEPVEPQPSQETMRDNLKWRQWCENQIASSELESADAEKRKP